MASHPGHALWKRDFTGASGLFSIVLKPVPQKAVYAFLDALELFGIGASWGGYESLADSVRLHQSCAPRRAGRRAARPCAFISGSRPSRTLIADLSAVLLRSLRPDKTRHCERSENPSRAKSCIASSRSLSSGRPSSGPDLLLLTMTRSILSEPDYALRAGAAPTTLACGRLQPCPRRPGKGLQIRGEKPRRRAANQRRTISAPMTPTTAPPITSLG